MTAVMESPKTQSITIADQKNTKIVATVGPACNQYLQLLELAKAGVNVFRLNFSHGEHATHLSVTFVFVLKKVLEGCKFLYSSL